MTKYFALIFLVLISACSLANDENRKTVEFSSGDKGEVFIEEGTVGGERVMVVDYRNDSPERNEDRIEKEVGEIWKAVSPEADKKGFMNVVIKYRLPAEDSETGNADTYAGVLFEAEKIENGTWKLRRVN